MLDERFVILGAVLAFLGTLSYLLSTLKGETKPNKVTWFIWALAPMIAFSAEIAQGVGLQSLLTFMVGFNPLLVFLASFVNKKAYWKIERFDIVSGGLALLGLFLWQITQVGNLAIAFAIWADGFAALPTIVKSYKFPETENYVAYATAAIAALITLLTIDVWNFEHWAFPLYILIATTIIFSLIKFQLGKKISKKI